MRQLSPPSSQQRTSESASAAGACEHSPLRPIATRRPSSHCITSLPPAYRSRRHAGLLAACPCRPCPRWRGKRCSRVNARREPPAAYALSCRPLSGRRLQLSVNGRTVRVGAACLQDVVCRRQRCLQCVQVLKLAPRQPGCKVDALAATYTQNDHLFLRADKRPRPIRPRRGGALYRAAEPRMVIRPADRLDAGR